MGSIYKHIQSKEDVLLALGHQYHLHFLKICEQVMDLPLPMVERMVAVQLVGDEHSSPYSFGPQLITLLSNQAVLQRASPGWLEKYIASSIAIEHLFRQKLIEACAAGELNTGNNDRETLVDEIITSVWAICVGHDQVLSQRNVWKHEVKTVRLESDSNIIKALQRLLNTYQWKTALTDELIGHACRELENRGLR